MTRVVLITGATGFAGSFLVQHYVAAGWTVHGTYREAFDSAWLPDGVHLHAVDLLDARAVDGVVEECEPDVVHHLAARSSVREALADPLGTITENARMQWNVLEAARVRAPGARITVTGSCDEYGNVPSDANPVDEQAALLPLNPYGISKVVQDTMGYQYAAVHNLDVVRVRPFLLLGPRRPARFATGSFAKQVAEIQLGLRRPQLEVGNIDLIRDFVDVRDVASAYVAIADRGRTAEVYNIASGVGHTLRELVENMLASARITADVVIRPDLVRAGEPAVLIGDAARLRHDTSWQPRLSFEQSARDALAYWRDRLQASPAGKGVQA